VIRLQFSCSILNSPEIAQKLFDNGVVKVNSFLTDLFGFDFTHKENLQDHFIDSNLHIYKTSFRIQDRDIDTLFLWNGSYGDLITEELIINEVRPEVVNIVPEQSFESSIEYITNFLILNMDVNITPLDLSEKAEKVLKDELDRVNLSWNLELVQEYSEGHAVVNFDYKSSPNTFTITRYSRHSILLE
jgi:hypothetical protein